MARVTYFQHCPSCRHRGVFTRYAVYQCQVCYRFFCDRCIRRRGFGRYQCPHCTAQNSFVRVGYTR
jgi:hypothetical protein